ncbi:YdcF family protein [Sinomonas sp. ASV322]|uniref:YdcF family protein n=1 Tax=Sinomonas sp. ASV322 TaxID=3041920 RepID=UPI0027DC074A|nr:YdcF family protein [Sinomonas sp. ASV322]MDQ4503808.1 YdcF family protein [Sinomonas sp. ASV322]
MLGFPADSRGRLSLVQRWRVRIAIRSTDPNTARFVFTGGITRGETSEAMMMAEHAIQAFGVPRHRIVLEERARTTWENIALSLPLIGDAPAIKIASNTFHARRARQYLAAQAPELAARLRRARDFVPGELALLKPILVAHEWRRARRESRFRLRSPFFRVRAGKVPGVEQGRDGVPGHVDDGLAGGCDPRVGERRFGRVVQRNYRNFAERTHHRRCRVGYSCWQSALAQAGYAAASGAICGAIGAFSAGIGWWTCFGFGAFGGGINWDAAC